MIILRIRDLRNEFQLTQEELGKKIGQTKSNISKYETGALEPGIDTIKRLAQIFNVSIDYILGDSDVKNPYEYEKYPEATKAINYAIEIAKEQGYDISNNSKEELAEILVKALKIDEINKSN